MLEHNGKDVFDPWNNPQGIIFNAPLKGTLIHEQITLDQILNGG